MKRKGLLLLLLLLVSGCGIQIREKEPCFDYYLDAVTQNDLEDLKNKPFVEDLFSFSLLIFQRPGYDNAMAGQFAVLVTPSFDSLNVSAFHPLIKKDTSIMQDTDCNPILIDQSLAKTEKLSIGDLFYQQTRISDEPMCFTIAGIFKQTPLFA